MRIWGSRVRDLRSAGWSVSQEGPVVELHAALGALLRRRPRSSVYVPPAPHLPSRRSR
jgi:hypothetical protein